LNIRENDNKLLRDRKVADEKPWAYRRKGLWDGDFEVKRGGSDAVEDYFYCLRSHAAQAFAMDLDGVHFLFALVAIGLRFLEAGAAHVIPGYEIPARTTRYRKMAILSRIHSGYRRARRQHANSKQQDPSFHEFPPDCAPLSLPGARIGNPKERFSNMRLPRVPPGRSYRVAAGCARMRKRGRQQGNRREMRMPDGIDG
jgi:hypothetical protein